MKRPFEFVLETFMGNLDKVRENQKNNFNNFEKFMTWIVGFSIGGLTIIVTNLTQFSQAFSHNTIKTILILLSISIISGIFYRWFFYLLQIQYQSIEFYLQGAFSTQEIMETDPDDLSNENDIKEVIRRLKFDFGEETSFVLDEYIKSNEDGKLFLLNNLKEYYKKTGENVKREYKSAMDYAKGIYKDAFGLSDKVANKMFEPNSSGKFKLFNWLTSIALLISCISFILVVIILCIKY